MMDKFSKQNVSKLANRLPWLWYLLCLYKIGRKREYLSDTGWLNSARYFSSVDAQNRPIPWLTYPLIDFAESRLSPNFKVFEYGGGNSTLWWAERVSVVDTVEHDKEWFEIVKKKIPSNVTLYHEPLNQSDEYATKPLETSEKYHIIIIDGRHRNLCAEKCVPALANDGVIIWDNTDRKKYEKGIIALANNGYKRIDFFGLSPINSTKTVTTIFYKENNCMGI